MNAEDCWRTSLAQLIVILTGHDHLKRYMILLRAITWLTLVLSEQIPGHKRWVIYCIWICLMLECNQHDVTVSSPKISILTSVELNVIFDWLIPYLVYIVSSTCWLMSLDPAYRLPYGFFSEDCHNLVVNLWWEEFIWVEFDVLIWIP